MNTATPIFRHDCTHCIYLGLYAKVGEPFADLYVCIDERNPRMSSVIARFSDYGPDYASCPISMPHLTRNKALHEAMFRAMEPV